MGFLEEGFLALNSARYFQIALKLAAQICIPIYHSKVTKSWLVPLGWKNFRMIFSSERRIFTCWVSSLSTTSLPPGQCLWAVCKLSNHPCWPWPLQQCFKKCPFSPGPRKYFYFCLLVDEKQYFFNVKMSLRRKKTPSPLILECFISTKADPIIEYLLCAQYCSGYQGYLSENKRKKKERENSVPLSWI